MNHNGKTREELLGRKTSCRQCLPFRVFDTGEYQNWEWTSPITGQTYQTHAYPFTDTDGSNMVVEMGVDITQRKEMENRLRESEQRYRQLAAENARLLEQARRDAETQATLLHEVNHRVKSTLPLLTFCL